MYIHAIAKSLPLVLMLSKARVVVRPADTVLLIFHCSDRTDPLKS